MSVTNVTFQPRDPAENRLSGNRFAEKLGFGASDLRLLEAVLRKDTQAVARKA